MTSVGTVLPVEAVLPVSCLYSWDEVRAPHPVQNVAAHTYGYWLAFVAGTSLTIPLESSQFDPETLTSRQTHKSRDAMGVVGLRVHYR